MKNIIKLLEISFIFAVKLCIFLAKNRKNTYFKPNFKPNFTNFFS
jgi:hypothetical protein